MQVDKFVGPLFWLGGGGQDAAGWPPGRSAEADGALKAAAHIVTLVLGDQGQKLLGLELALDLLGEQAVEELQGVRAEFAEAFA